MRLVAALLLALATACTTLPADAPQVAPLLTSAQAQDPWTHARPQEARVTHTALDLALDFAARQAVGTATIDLAAAPGVGTLVLDEDGLQIDRVTDAAGKPLPFTLGEKRADGLGGRALTIAVGTARRIVVHYASDPGAAALQWLAPEQTLGGKQPYLFSQGQSILNRSWIPLQDSPGIRQTWEARIVAPAPLRVVMSGTETRAPETLGDGRRAFFYRMDKPVAPYLIAIAAGDIVHRDLGPRTGVWTEPQLIDAAAAELADTEAMVAAAEALFGPYRWGRYDLLVLPPAFPYGGMENPTLTFLTPTFIVGDKSGASLVAHELAHSWSGNLVTNATWSDFWLNEGITSYFESRISERLYGATRVEQSFANSHATMARKIAELGPDSPLTALHQGTMRDPEDFIGEIAYQKGALFMRTIERTVGRARFDAWLRHWFDSHAFQPATSELLLADMREHLVAGDAALETRLALDEWVYGTGLPANAVTPDPAVFAQVDAAIGAYLSAGTIPVAAWQGWSSNERERFLRGIPEKRTADQLAALDRGLGLSDAGSYGTRRLWIVLALSNRYEPAIPVAERFMVGMGRWAALRPIFQALMAQGDWGRQLAHRLYAENSARWHSATRARIEPVLAGG